MKILFVSNVRSYIGQFHTNFINLLKENGHTIDVSCFDNSADKDGFDFKSINKFHFIPLQRSPYKKENIKAIKQLKELIIKEKEGQLILSKIKDNMFVIAMDLNAKQMTSEEFSKFIETQGVMGNSNITFVIGGSLGLSQAVIKRANHKVCFSKMTFPHQMMRMILMEQIYRSYRILNHEPYHK